MATPERSTSPPLSVACPHCGERLAVRYEDLGKRGQCRRCSKIFRIGKLDDRAPQPVSGSATPAAPDSVGFSCELCETRLTARVADVGRKVKCPDCGRINVIPAPAPVRHAVQPAAMSGAQFDVWGVDEAPPPTELAARAPRLHPVECALCQTLMYATDQQLGQKLKCPDCGTLTVAVARPPEKPKGPVIVPDGEEYQLDETSAPTPRPVVVPMSVRDLAAQPAAVPDGKSDKPNEAPTRQRLGDAPPTRGPQLPSIPLVQGVARMLLTSELLVRWVIFSLSLTVIGWFLSWVLSAMSNQVFLALPMFAIGCVFTSAWLVFVLPVLLAMVIESSEGNDQLHDPPSWLSLEFAEVLVLVVAAAVSVFAAWLTTKATVTLPQETQLAIAAGAFLLCFPIVLLSDLDQSSAFAVFSPRLGWSLVRCAGPWLLFYLQSAALAAAILYLGKLVLEQRPGLWPILPWIGMATLFLYMRLIGRLAWWIAEKMAVVEEATG